MVEQTLRNKGEFGSTGMKSQANEAIVISKDDSNENINEFDIEASTSPIPVDSDDEYYIDIPFRSIDQYQNMVTTIPKFDLPHSLLSNENSQHPAPIRPIDRNF